MGLVFSKTGNSTDIVLMLEIKYLETIVLEGEGIHSVLLDSKEDVD